MKLDSKIYIAGHRGLLGSAVIRKLQSSGYNNLLLRTSEELDLRDQKQTFDFIKSENPEYVFLCAAKTGGIQANINCSAEFLYDNLAIQNNVVHASYLASVKKLLFVGSSCIYPKDISGLIREEHLLTGHLEPTNEGYAIAKIAGVKLVQFYRKQFGVDFISAIPTNLYGINDHYDIEKSNLIPALIMKIHKAMKNNERTVAVWGTGHPRRDFMLSDDCAEALLFLMHNYSSSQIINIGTGYDLSIIEIAETVRRALKADVRFELDPSKPDGMMRKLMDTTPLSSLGWKPKHDLYRGVEIAYNDFVKRYE